MSAPHRRAALTEDQLMFYRVALFTLVCAVALTAGASPRNGPTDRQTADRRTPTHQERPDDPYLPGAPAAKKPIVAPGGWRVLDGFVSVQVNVDAQGNNIVGDAANEPSLAVDPTNPDRIAIGWRQFDTIASNFRQAGYAWSSDEGQTWTFPGALDPGVFRSDPVVDADADGNFYYYSLCGSGCGSGFSCQMFKSIDGGVSWAGPTFAYGGDKAWMAIDRTGGIGRGNIYCAWDHFGCCGSRVFTRSLDGGLNYSIPIPIPGFPIWGTVTVDPDGIVQSAVVGPASSRARSTVD